VTSSQLWKGFVEKVGFERDVKRGVMDNESGDDER